MLSNQYGAANGAELNTHTSDSSRGGASATGTEPEPEPNVTAAVRTRTGSGRIHPPLCARCRRMMSTSDLARRLRRMHRAHHQIHVETSPTVVMPFPGGDRGRGPPLA